ncbi:MAG: hypothetical protein ACT4PL_01160, partial [Phycisphaerales bacterium]
MTEPARRAASPATPSAGEVRGPASDSQKLALLLELTQIPTATGREQRVVAFIRAWAAARPDVAVHADGAGNLSLHMRPRNRAERKRRGRESYDQASHRPLYITAHLDHPAFVVERTPEGGAATFEVSFRGGVMDVFFEHAPIVVHTSAGARGATLVEEVKPGSPAGKHYRAELDGGAAEAGTVRVGDVAQWRLPAARIDERGVLHTHACDDLAAAAAALAAFDELRAARERGEKIEEVRLLFTRGEEIGFLGAIAACKLGTMARGSRVIALENSRSFADSPLGGGPIVRVGDRLSVFTPWLTAACCARAEEVFGGASTPRANEPAKAGPRRPWQRKLMAGGACEASVFCLAGYDA